MPAATGRFALLAGADSTRARPGLHPVRGAHTVPDRPLEFTQAYRKDTTPWARAKVEGLYLFMLRERRRHQPRA
ncbi:MAG: hypothetical protein EP309_03220 [Gammaproteobacteria bacterium]|nr:MAG: hypothetical protein EP309_03220 [Gammaproteobacteria bacterium]